MRTPADWPHRNPSRRFPKTEHREVHRLLKAGVAEEEIALRFERTQEAIRYHRIQCAAVDASWSEKTREEIPEMKSENHVLFHQDLDAGMGLQELSKKWGITPEAVKYHSFGKCSVGQAGASRAVAVLDDPVPTPNPATDTESHEEQGASQPVPTTTGEASRPAHKADHYLSREKHDALHRDIMANLEPGASTPWKEIASRHGVDESTVRYHRYSCGDAAKRTQAIIAEARRKKAKKSNPKGNPLFNFRVSPEEWAVLAEHRAQAKRRGKHFGTWLIDQLKSINGGDQMGRSLGFYMDDALLERYETLRRTHPDHNNSDMLRYLMDSAEELEAVKLACQPPIGSDAEPNPSGEVETDASTDNEPESGRPVTVYLYGPTEANYIAFGENHPDLTGRHLASHWVYDLISELGSLQRENASLRRLGTLRRLDTLNEASQNRWMRRRTAEEGTEESLRSIFEPVVRAMAEEVVAAMRRYRVSAQFRDGYLKLSTEDLDTVGKLTEAIGRDRWTVRYTAPPDDEGADEQ